MSGILPLESTSFHIQSDAELFEAVKKVDIRGRWQLEQLQTQQEKTEADTITDAKASQSSINRSSNRTAMLLNTSPRRIEKIRTIIDHGDFSIQEKISNGKLSIEEAYRKSIRLRDIARIVRATEDKNAKPTLVSIFSDIKYRLEIKGQENHKLIVQEVLLLKEIIAQCFEAGFLTGEEVAAIKTKK